MRIDPRHSTRLAVGATALGWLPIVFGLLDLVVFFGLSENLGIAAIRIGIALSQASTVFMLASWVAIPLSIPAFRGAVHWPQRERSRLRTGIVSLWIGVFVLIASVLGFGYLDRIQ